MSHLISVDGVSKYRANQTSSESASSLSGSGGGFGSLLSGSLSSDRGGLSRASSSDRDTTEKKKTRIVPDPTNAVAGLVLTNGPGRNSRVPHINLNLVSHIILVDGLDKYRVHQTSSEPGSSQFNSLARYWEYLYLWAEGDSTGALSTDGNLAENKKKILKKKCTRGRFYGGWVNFNQWH